MTSKARFRFSTQLLARLGEELNPGPDQSILELVKNAYDADARTCTVELIGTDAPDGTLVVSDDGDGMDEDGLADGWLVLGRSGKESRALTRTGRVPAGSKGLGRLAALRLGSLAGVTTRPLAAPHHEYTVHIDWTAFDSVDVVEEVEFEIKRRRSTSTASGTEVRLEHLRSALSRSDVQRLARAMLLLADPFAGKQSFRAVLKTPGFRDLEKLVRDRYFNQAEYHLHAVLDAKGKASAEVVDWRGETLFSAGHAELAPEGGRPYEAPPAEFDLWAFILSPQTFAGRGIPLAAVKEWLKAFGGIHLYENGLRVAPYGNPGNDWLDLNLARTSSPEERPSTNTAIGRLSVDNSGHSLRQKTDRSGYVENDPFLELKRFGQHALAWMARRRLAVAQTRRAAQREHTRVESRAAKQQLQKVLTEVSGKTRTSVEAAVKRYEQARNKEVDVLKREVQLYRTLGTAGITAATFAHESSGNAVKVIGQAAKTIERRGRELLRDRYDQALAEPVSLVARGAHTLGALGSITLSLVDHEKRRSGRVDVHETVSTLLKMFQPFLTERKVRLQVKLSSGPAPVLRATESAIEAVVANLVTNGLYWLEQSHENSRILEIATRVEASLLELHVADSGPGLEGISADAVWLPGETTKPNGSGLGLAIVYDTVRDLGGTATALAHGALGGAEFVVTLPLIRN
jgi:signal transduction histidine kinase